MNKVMNAIHEAEVMRRGHAKEFESKKMLKAKIFQLIHRLMDERPLCANHTKHQRDYHLKLDFVNSRRDRAKAKAAGGHQLSKSYQMLIASEKAKRGIDNFPRLHNINEALFREFTESELQTMFLDLRFFFPDDKIYKRLSIFHDLDIYEGEHFRIKETYKEKVKRRKAQKRKN